MGLDRTIHVEAFIKIPIQYHEREITIRTCGEHEDHRGCAFCPVCGKEIKEVKQPTKTQVAFEDFTEQDNLWDYTEGETMYLFSNLYDCGIETEENTFTTLTPELIQEKIHCFEAKHKNDIKLLAAKINAEIKVEFGFLYQVW
jgi:hypothetical protein